MNFGRFITAVFLLSIAVAVCFGDTPGIKPNACPTSPSQQFAKAISGTGVLTCQTPSGSGGGGISSINSQTEADQTMVVGTSGSNFAISSASGVHTFNLPTASGSNRGALSSSDWTAFNGKESALTFSAPLSRSANTISCIPASGSANGCLSSSDWSAFNSKQAAGNYITALTGDVTAAGPGSVSSVISDQAVSNAKLAQVSTATIKGRASSGTGNVEDLTAAQATSVLNTFTSSLKGLVPAPVTPVGNCLKDDGTWGSCGGGGGGGVTTVGTFSGTSIANGASISGSTITFGPADGTNPGMVSTGTQTLAGNKTLTGSLTTVGTPTVEALASPFAITTNGVIMSSTGGYSSFPFMFENAGGGTGPNFAFLTYGSTNSWQVMEALNSSGAYREIAQFGGAWASNTAGAEVGDFAVKVSSGGSRPSGETPALLVRGLDKSVQVRGGIQLNNDTGGTSVPKPTCNSTNRGTTWITRGGAGVADVVEECNKDAADAYAWATAGNTVGPSSSTDGGVPLYNGVTGKLLKDSSVVVSGNAVTLGVAASPYSLTAKTDGIANSTKASLFTIQGSNKTAGTGDSGDIKIKAGVVSNGAGFPGSVIIEAGGGDNAVVSSSFSWQGNWTVANAKGYLTSSGSGIVGDSGSTEIQVDGSAKLYVYPSILQPGINSNFYNYGENRLGANASTIYPWMEAHLTRGITLAYEEGDTNPDPAAGEIIVETGTPLTFTADYVRFNSAEITSGSDVMTMTNGPAGAAGNPAKYLRVNINGTDYVIPAWPYTP